MLDNKVESGLHYPAAMFFNLLREMPDEFFAVYNFLISKGVSHDTADKAAREAWKNNFKA